MWVGAGVCSLLPLHGRDVAPQTHGILDGSAVLVLAILDGHRVSLGRQVTPTMNPGSPSKPTHSAPCAFWRPGAWGVPMHVGIYLPLRQSHYSLGTLPLRGDRKHGTQAPSSI